MTKIEQTPTFNLGVVLQETGLNADTLRAWERRYGMPTPARSEGGHRLYSQLDIDTIKWLLSRQDEGMSISKAINLWRTIEDEGRDPLQELPSRLDSLQKPAVEIPVGAKIQELRAQWVSACLEFNEAAAEQIIGHAFALFPPETVCFDVMFDGLSEIGEAWYQRNVTVQQEHFTSALVARRLHALMAAAPVPIHNQSIVVGCPPKEEHELSALLIAYLLRSRGWNVVYLGANVPLEDFENTLASVKPYLIILVAQTLQTAAALKEVALALNSQKVPLAFGGLIFNRMSTLIKQVPGVFLGSDLKQFLPLAEKLLNTPHSAQIGASAVADIDYAPLNYFALTRPLIEEKMYEVMGSNIPMNYLQIANQHMAEDIAAAVKLGNFDYLGGELEWVRGLLGNASLPDELLAEYLHNYLQVADQIFDERGQEIVTWMETVNRKFDR